MNPVVSVYTPEARLIVQSFNIAEGVGPDEGADIPYDPLDPAFLICPAGIAGIKRKPIVSCEVQKLRVVRKLRLSAYYYTLEIVIPVGAGSSLGLPEGFYVSLKKELHGVPGIELHIQISGVRQKIDKSIYNTKGQCPLHPVYLRLLTG